MDRLGDDVRAELRRFGPQAGMADLVECWPVAVGAAIARQAWPARISRDGTVHVNTADSMWAFELTQRADEIARRIGAPGVRFAPGPLPEPEPVERMTADVALPEPADIDEARRLAAAITDENLRETVQRAVSFSLARGRSGRPF